MQKMFLAIVAMFLWVGYNISTERSAKLIASQTAADTNSPGNVSYARPVDGGLADDYFIPFPEKSNKAIIHHGDGWFYFPSNDSIELNEQFEAFERKYPKLERGERLQDVLATQSGETAERFPRFTTTYTGEFMKYRARLAPKG